MLNHIVMWKLKDFAEGNPKEENAKIIKKQLESLKESVPQIKDIKVEVTLRRKNRSEAVKKTNIPQ